jgi:hypothetical protein
LLCIASPSVPSESPIWAFKAGIRTAQFATANPLRKKMASVTTRAVWIWLEVDSVGSVGFMLDSDGSWLLTLGF